MSIFDDIRTKGATYRLTEEALYAEALREIESGQRRDGVWAKALAESEMDHGKAGAKYIKLRVQSLKDEVSVVVAEARREETIERQKELNRAQPLTPTQIQQQPKDEVAPSSSSRAIHEVHETPQRKSTIQAFFDFILTIAAFVVIVSAVVGGVFSFMK